ncbi:MAG: ATPase, T2SS/T4P/T4SS family [Thermodesulfobacteriota bacterium]
MNPEQEGDAQLKDKAQELLDLALSLNKARNTDEILLDLVKQVTEVLGAERATIYALDQDTGRLYSRAKVDADIREIQVPVSNDSVAGFTAKNSQSVNLSDAYDLREIQKYPGLKFDDSWDRMSGFKTRSILSLPLAYKDTGLQGVVQIINHTAGKAFTKAQEKVLAAVARAVAVAFYNQGRIRREPTKFDLLLEREAVTAETLKKAESLAAQHRDHPVLGDVVSVLLREFNVSRVMMGKSLARYYQTEVFEFREDTEAILDLIDELGISVKYLSEYLWVPVRREGDVAYIVTDDPGDRLKITEIIGDVQRRGFARECRFLVGFREDIKRFLNPDYVVEAEPAVTQVKPEDLEDASIDVDGNAPTIVKLVNAMIRDAFDSRASDIHIEPYGRRDPATVRFRVDGVCFNHSEIRPQYTRGVTNRLKIMSKLKVDEHRLPQSGKIKLKYQEKDVELRVEVTPTVGGNEDVVLRILTASEPLPLAKMNFSEKNLAGLHEIVAKPYGIILCVGPTGSGKTTTLHAILGHINTPDRKIWTAEDPVEITQRGLRQVQINMNIRPEPLSFAAAMRSFLRADPDVIMVGEMRDRETAAIAIEASLTGHLVLSTLHTNSAPETITRIVEMDLDPINVSDAILGILAQRLVRTFCENCKEKYTASAEEIERLCANYGEPWARELGLDPAAGAVLYRLKGCHRCNDQGYRGRTGIHELLLGTREMKRLIRRQAPIEEMRELGLEQGMRTLKMDGIQKVLQGQTDLTQVLKVCIE